MSGSQKRFLQLTKADALQLLSIINNLTPSRVGSHDEFLFLAGVAQEIEATFGETVSEIRSRKP